MGTIKTTNIETITGSGTLTLGQSGETITIPSGATLTVPSGGLSGQNYPAFLVKLTANYNIATGTSTKIQYTTEVFDTDGAYDNSTNYRFTVPSGQAGKYFFYFQARANGWGSNRFVSWLYVTSASGSTDTATAEMITASASYPSIQSSVVLDLNDGDFVEHYVFHDQGGTQPLQGSSTEHQNLTFFGGYRIGD